MRKGHGSTKVPGVKLRPAQASSKTRSAAASSSQSVWKDMSYGDDLDSFSIIQSGGKPFTGFVFTSTGVSDKLLLTKLATQLGAKLITDLTDQVTHLISEGARSKKHSYCVEHDIPVMHPSWILDTHEKWTAGEDMDLKSSIANHRLKPFTGVRLSMTAIEDMEARKQIRKLVQKNGGSYFEGAVNKENYPTHLLCGSNRGNSSGISSKMEQLQNLNKTETRIHMVWEDWFWDCLEFKGRLDEIQYDAFGPRPKRKEKRAVSPDMTPLASSADPRSQWSNIDLTAGEEEELRLKSRDPQAAQKMWCGLLKTRGFEMKSGKLMRSPSKQKQTIQGSIKASDTETYRQCAELEASTDSTRKISSLRSALTRTSSFAPKAPLENLRGANGRPKRADALQSRRPVREGDFISEQERKLFAGLTFKAVGAANTPHIAVAIEARGGTFTLDTGADVDVILVRLNESSLFFCHEPRQTERDKFRTECWLEQCIFEEKLCDADCHPAFRSLQLEQAIDGADKLVLHISGLELSEKTSAVRLIKAIGAQYTDMLTRQNTHLICPDGSGPKAEKAVEWGIHVVNLQWLFESVKTGHLQEPEHYDSSVLSTSSMQAELNPITDITNSAVLSASSRSSHSSTTSEKRPVTPHKRSEPNSKDEWVPNELLFDSPRAALVSSPARKLSNMAINSSPRTPSRLSHQPTDVVPDSREPSPLKTAGRANNSEERIPSSATPSPLKMPTKQTEVGIPSNQTSLGPTATLSEGSVIVLKDALVSLLGKRTSSTDDPSIEGSTSSSDQQQNRAAKRVKPPPRSKARGLSRSGSASELAMVRTNSSLSAGEYPLSEGLHTPIELAQLHEEDGNDTMRVTYEDPSQRAEGERLQRLLSGRPDHFGERTDESQISEVTSRAEDSNTWTEISVEEAAPKRRRGKNLVRRSTRISEVE